VIKVFLQGFPKGTNMMDGKLSSPKLIKCASISKLNEGVKKWIDIEGIKAFKKCVKQVDLTFYSCQKKKKSSRAKLKSTLLSVDNSKHFSEFSLPGNSIQSSNQTSQSLNIINQIFFQQNNPLPNFVFQKQNFPSSDSFPHPRNPNSFKQ
jgi:hypothetical protein